MTDNNLFLRMPKDANVVAVIPARGGSKGVLRKNLQQLYLPLITRSIKSATLSKYVNKVVVSTDDCEIAEVANSESAYVIQRPSRQVLILHSKMLYTIQLWS